MRLCQIILTFWLFIFPVQAASLTQDFETWEAQQKSSAPSASAVADLAARHPEWPGLTKLTGIIEEQRSFSGLDNSALIALFAQKRPTTSAGIVAYITALGTTAQGQKELQDIWRTEKLDSATQDFVMQQFATRLSGEDHDARLDMLLDNDRITQAQNLSDRLSIGAKDYTNMRSNIARGAITDLSQVPSAYQNRPQILADFIKVYTKNERYDLAAAALNRLGPITSDVGGEIWKSRHIVAREELEKGSAQNAYQLLQSHTLSIGQDFAAAEFLCGFVSFKFLNNPKKASQHFYALYNGVTGTVSKSRAAYWMGRSAEALNDRNAATAWYQKAAAYPTTYFGQQALGRLGQPLTAAMLASRGGGVGSASDDAMVQGARYFYGRGLPGYARQFLMAAARNTTSSATYESLSAMAAQNNDRAGLVKLAREVGKQGVIVSRSGFPLLTRAEQDHARSGGMSNIALVHAIIRQESEFDDQAQSHAGARGLMQLMPATAKDVARRQGVTHDTAWLTGRPDHNIRLGSAYLAALLQRYNGSKVLAIAAYNAGPGRVSGWIERFGDPRTNEVATEDWIELIPVYETRNYIQRVLEGEAVYASLI